MMRILTSLELCRVTIPRLILTLGEFVDEFAESFDQLPANYCFSEIRGVIKSFRKRHRDQLQILLCTCL
jgi:hypothetical protein